jgi:hypothetical protein
MLTKTTETIHTAEASDRELADVLFAISVLSRRLSRKLYQKTAAEQKGGRHEAVRGERSNSQSVRPDRI